MATKKASGKKGSTKKSAGKKSSKAAKKSSKKAGALFPPPPNIQCILSCVRQLNACIQKGVDRETCIKRFQRCVLRCMGIRDEGGLGGEVDTE